VKTCYQLATRFLPATYQAALLLDYARSQDLDEKALFKDTRLGAADLVNDRMLLTPGEYLQLLSNLNQALPARDSSFMLGQQLLPGHLDNLSHALLQARDLRQALDILIRYQAWLSPLLVPHLMTLGDKTALYWSEGCVTPRLRGFLVEMMMTAVTGMCRWLSGMRLPWSYRFNRTRAVHIEQYAVHLGTETRFNDYFDAMLIDSVWLDWPWPRGNEMTVSRSLAAVEQRVPADFARRSLLAALYDYLSERIRLAPTLERTSADFGCSSATFKRHLALHHTHFQAELDLVRSHVALRIIDSPGYSNERIAAYLGFHDANNFRRSFKRWTGLTPSMLRAQLLDSSVLDQAGAVSRN
jgi:AraC-like DNA-binding protein